MEDPWKIHGTHGFPWVPMSPPESPWVPMGTHGTLHAFLDFEMLVLRRNARHFLRAFSLFFGVFARMPNAGTFAIILWLSGPFLWLFVHFSLLVFRFLAPTALCLGTSHTIWRIFPWLRGARPQCVETRQPRHPQCAFWPHPWFAFGTISDALLLTFSGFVILLKLCSPPPCEFYGPAAASHH